MAVKTKTTRYYITPGSNQTYPTPKVEWSESWNTTPGDGTASDMLARRPMTTVPVTAGVNGSLASRPSARPNSTVANQFIFPPFEYSRKLDGEIRMAMSATYIGESYLRVGVRLIDETGHEKAWVATATSAPVYDGNILHTRAITIPLDEEIVAEAGDFLVIELGLWISSGLGGSARVNGTYQNPVGDYPLIDGVNVDDMTLRPWVEIELVDTPKPSRLVWSGKPKYETGLDRGVFYSENGRGFVWNGLISVDDAHVGGEVESLYRDGIKYLDLQSGKNYQATLSAYSYPEEFAECNGDSQPVRGLVLTRQPRKRFGFSYRTLLGAGLGYRIHLVYNALATPTGRGHTTLNEQPTPDIRTWQIDATPLLLKQSNPTAHFFIDSTDVSKEQLETIESILYGTDTRYPYLPTPGQLAKLTTDWDPMIIQDDPDTGLSPLVAGTGDLIESDILGLYISLPSGRLYESAIRGLYTLTE